MLTISNTKLFKLIVFVRNISYKKHYDMADVLGKLGYAATGMMAGGERV